MSEVILRLKQDPVVTLEAEVITPDKFAEMSHEQICESIVYHGKRQLRLDEFFEVEGEKSEHIVLHGDMHRVRHLGRAMTMGSLTAHGDVGMHLGAHMKGGEICIRGNAGDWVGAEMSGGKIHVRGEVGQQVGAAYRGSLAGMKGGIIIVDGSAGIEVGMRMKRGTIFIRGSVKDFAGLQMIGGTIILGEGAEIRTGAWMQRGTIISLKPIDLMPTFGESGVMNPTFISVYSNLLKPHGCELPNDQNLGGYRRFAGDRSVPGKGEILIWQEHALN